MKKSAASICVTSHGVGNGAEALQASRVVPSMMEMEIALIRIGERVRKDMGDIGALAASIEQHGLIHPPAVTSEGVLIAGQRRLLAYSQLGKTSIPVRIIDVRDLLSAERDENKVRKDFTPSEAVSVARTIEARLKAASKERRSHSAKARWARQKGHPVELAESASFTQASLCAATAVGMGRERYDQAKEVVEAAEQEADKFGDLVEMMDATGSVHPAHAELRRRRDGHPTRHPVLRRMRHRDPNQEIAKAITSLSGLALGIERIDVTGLDVDRIEEWTSEIKLQITSINRFLRRLNHEHIQ